MGMPFGELDIEDVPTSVKNNTYTAELFDVNKYTDEKDTEYGREYWVLRFRIVDDEYFAGETADMFVNMFPGMTQEKYNALPDNLPQGQPGMDKSRMRDAQKFYKRVATQLGFSDGEVKLGVDFTQKIGNKYKANFYSDKNNQTRIAASRGITPVDGEGTGKFSDLGIS